ncbi:MAG: UDP-2,4-diacetamido-2,4,6-trideoxy-beta-L-altropyranose hydrolase [Cyclobacteriaceae bacterium]
MKKSLYRIVFRVDGNADIGHGHISRCLSLADILCKHFKITFALVDYSKTTLSIIESYYFTIETFSNNNEFLRTINDYDIVVLDLKILQESLQLSIKERVKKLIIIDDENKDQFHADIVINHAPGLKISPLQNSSLTKFYFGLDYAILQKQFLSVAKEINIEKRGNHLFVCFGGSDPLDLTSQIVQSIEPDIFDNIHLVIGPSYDHGEKLNEICKHKNFVQIHQGIDVMEMCVIMKKCTYAIVPASTILYEALACGLIVTSGYYVANQLNIYNGFKELNTFFDAENFNQTSLKLAINQMSSSNKTETKRLIDGNSSERLLSIFMDLI